MKTKLVKPNAPGKERPVRWQVFCATASLGAAFACCASEAGHITQKPRLAGEGRLAPKAAGRNCYMLAGEGFGKTRKFCPPCAVERLRQFAVPRSGFGAGFGSCGADWSLRLLEIASSLGSERPFRSAKVVDGERRWLVEVLGNHERLGKNGCWRWHNSNGRGTAVCQQISWQHPPPYPAKSVGYGVGFNKFTLAERPASGGQPA